MVYNKSSNPALHTIEYVKHTDVRGAHMTAEGAYNKTLILTTLVIIAGFFGWNTPLFLPVTALMIVSLVVGLVIAFTLAFKPLLAKYLAPVYSLVQGYFLGVVSLFFESIYPGIVIQAVLLTLVVAFLMNILYRNKIIKVTQKFILVITMAMFAIFGVYMVSFIVSFFGTTIPYIHESGPIGIIFSLVVVTVASLMLVVDYHFIEQTAKRKVPKDIEWYGAFALMVTLIWLYLEILRLLAKLRGR